LIKKVREKTPDMNDIEIMKKEMADKIKEMYAKSKVANLQKF